MKNYFHIETDPKRAMIPFLSWDAEDGPRGGTNLLRQGAGVILQVQVNGRRRASSDISMAIESPREGTTVYRLAVAQNTEIRWDIELVNGELVLAFSGEGKALEKIEAVELIFPFDPRVTPTTVLPYQWAEDGKLFLPAVINAPDFGQTLLKDSVGRHLSGRLQGSRVEKTVDLSVDLGMLHRGERCTLNLTPVFLPPPKGLNDASLWQAARRGWFGAFQPSSEWHEQGGLSRSAPAGVLANNVVSDPASCSLWFYADQMLWTPEVAPGISIAALVRRTLDWWLDKRTRENGEVICYWDFGGFLDANAGPLIAAWDYIEATDDAEWLGRCIGQLEFIADFLARRDIDGDGMVEATQSGNRGTLFQPERSCAWWDAINCGHKDGYTNALIYRAWRCLAELEAKLGRTEQKARYSVLADKLKSAYSQTLFNPQTGWLGWWRSADGELHDYATPIVNGLAIEYGLVDPTLGREILSRLRRKINEVGFTRFDLGVPPMLVPVSRSDYLQPDALGIPKREDGTDTFGQYMNGGITAGHTLHFLAAHYVLGEQEEADRILHAMLARQERGEFQNGVRDKDHEGIDWTTWDGKPCGYEGYLADSFRFLQAVLLREPEFRTRYYRPLIER